MNINTSDQTLAETVGSKTGIMPTDSINETDKRTREKTYLSGIREADQITSIQTPMGSSTVITGK